MKYTAGLAVGQMSGSLNGITASHNRFGPYFRDRAVPTNPSSPRQNMVRVIFAAVTNRWSAILTQTQRDQWQVYANAIGWKDKLGKDIVLTGFNMFLRSNTIAARAGLPPIDDGPVILTLANTDPDFEIACSEATQLVSVTFDPDLPWVDEDDACMQVLMSRPVNASVGFITPTFRLGDSLLGDSTTPLTSPQTFAAPFPVAENQRILCAGRILRADGRLSNQFRDDASVAS